MVTAEVAAPVCTQKLDRNYSRTMCVSIKVVSVNKALDTPIYTMAINVSMPRICKGAAMLKRNYVLVKSVKGSILFSVAQLRHGQYHTEKEIKYISAHE